MKIGILQTGIVPEDLSPNYGEYPDMFKTFLGEHDFEFKDYSVVNGTSQIQLRNVMAGL